MEIRAWSPSMEESWLAEHRERVARSTAPIAALGAAAIAGFGIVDLSGGFSPALLILRFGVMVPALVAAYLLARRHSFRDRFEAFAAGVVTVVTICEAAYLVFAPSDRAAIYQTGFVLLLFGAYVGTRISVRKLAAAGLLASAVDLAILVVVDLPGWHRVAMMLYVAVANVVGLWVARNQERLARQLFEDETALRDQHEELARLAASLRDAAMRDALTGLWNRRALDDRLGEAVAAARRRGGDGALVLVDLDGFKGVNDSMGHGVGDEVLREVGRVLADSMRENERAYRMGGDEFCLLLPDADEEEARAAAERVLRRLQSRFAGLALNVGFSAGCTEIRAADRSPDDPLGRADALLYAAKEGGKGRVVASRDARVLGPLRPSAEVQMSLSL